MNNTATKIRKFIVEEIMYQKNESALDYDASLLEGGIIDSTAILQLITYLQDEFKVSISNTDIVPENFDTVNSIANFIEARRN